MHHRARAAWAKLPREAADAIREAIRVFPLPNAREPKDHARGFALTKKAFARVAFPTGDVYPLAKDLTEAQRAIAELTCDTQLPIFLFAMPRGTWCRRWLGVDEPGLFEKTMVKGQPLWRALQLANVDGQVKILNALPIATSFAVLADIVQHAAYGIDPDIRSHPSLKVLDKLRGEGRAWAIAEADRYEPKTTTPWVLHLVMIALVRAKVPIAPKWEKLFPNIADVPDEILVECALALADDRRDAVLREQIERSLGASVVLAVLTKKPSADVTRAILAHTEPNSRGWELLVRDLRKLGKKHSVIRDALDEALVAAPKAIKLVLKSKRRLRVDEASSVVTRNQLRVARKLYGPKLDHERIELRVIADAHGNDRFDVLQYGDAGAIFRAGTNDLIGGVMQGGLYLDTPDAQLRLAIQIAAFKK